MPPLPPPAVSRDGPEPAARRHPVTWAIQVDAAVVLCGFGTALYLARVVQPPQGYQAASIGLVDPETTGSIGLRGRAGGLDPCSLPPRDTGRRSGG